MATLFVVGTPIGNLEDITLRALRVLKEADLVLCEDTRVTRNLLAKYDIATATMSYHAQSKLSKTDKIFELLSEGKNLALVSDAGTPGISDPGIELVRKIRSELPEVSVVAIPGASALTAALSIAGVPAADFLFLGFFPHKKGRETLFREISASQRAVVFYESPHRILKTLQSLKEHFEKAKISDRKISIARELTKIYEEIAAGSASSLLDYFEKNAEKVRGEFVVIISPL